MNVTEYSPKIFEYVEHKKGCHAENGCTCGLKDILTGQYHPPIYKFERWSDDKMKEWLGAGPSAREAAIQMVKLHAEIDRQKKINVDWQDRMRIAIEDNAALRGMVDFK